MKLSREAVDKLREVEGVEAVLTDPEDLYVYAREKPFSSSPRYIPVAVVKVKPNAVEQVANLAVKLGLTPIIRGEGELNQPKLLVIDSFTTPDLDQLEEEAKAAEAKMATAKEQALSEILKTGINTPRRFSIALEGILRSRQPELCKECKVCTGYCTVAPFFNYVETWSSKGRLMLIHGYKAGELKPTPKLAEVVYSCTLCGACFMRCLHGGFPNLETFRAIMAARRDLGKEGLAPESFKAMAENVSSLGNPFASTPDMRWMWLEEVEPAIKVGGKAEILYWVGCTTGIRFPEVAKAVVELLRIGGVDFTVLGEPEGCCGDPLFLAGMWEEAEKAALKVLEVIKKGGYSTLVTACAGCYHAFSIHYPELLGIELPCEVLHVSQLLERMLKENKLTPGRLEVKVSYHDPCELGRLSGVYEPPRKVLRSIEGLELREPRFNRERSRCCGGGGGLWAYKNQVSMDAASLRLTKDIQPLNVDKLVTACPACYMNFKYTALDRSLPVEVIDLAELVLEAVQVEQKNG
ncbi:MAG: hypothetical protein DRN06_08900 [Thermoprotei archaeon]|nr:MAG: hypothetical protein DRN06_08900 [Thermoprotei archaeon]